MDLNMRGFLPQSLVDYPDNIAAVVFFGGCNMSCPFCYNKDLVKAPDKYEKLTPEWVLNELERRKKFLDGVVLSGGEPTLYDLAEFIKKIKEIGMLVKLDTNGLNPEALEELLPLVDYVAMDVKAARRRYKDAAGVDLDIKKIEKSIKILKESGRPHEFRTTVVPAFIPEEDFDSLVEFVEGAENYYIQQYRPVKQAGPLSKAYEPAILEKLAEVARKKVKNVGIRGI
ncbi:MAG: anaerobic ribonucleoside-triphosphate reductase activating protein [Candidatus Diapherotrites archaeon]|nr:anaerobic ribonucleoside-triphosphate reductase activating protein [Candidatus Diapherotrites archaeon]